MRHLHEHYSFLVQVRLTLCIGIGQVILLGYAILDVNCTLW